MTVPPVQCPSCGRFLSNAFVEGLETGPSPCPKCETSLRAEMFAVEPSEDSPSADESVRPPDLTPEVVREDDPLSGWDSAEVVSMDEWRRVQQPVPDATVLATAGIAGALLGAVVSKRRGRGALLGGLSGLVAGAAARRIWLLPD